MSRRPRILFFAEAVTLAHITRPLVLAKSLNTNEYEVHFACADGYKTFFNDTDFTVWTIDTIPSQQFMEALDSGSRLYDYQTLCNYLEDDLRIIDAVSPDLIVGDFRLSLAVSAPLRKVPYVAITNAHWSPWASSDFPMPEHPMTSLVGVNTANFVFQIVRPAIFKYHGIPINRLRRRHGLQPLGDLRHAYTHGDYTLYADLPALIPTHDDRPTTHSYIGPVLWSPDMALPDWWNKIDPDKPCVYITLGSSGRSDLLPLVTKAMGKLSLTAIVATAGRLELDNLPANVYVADYLPGLEAARKADLVICSGGSATAYQALSQGTPILGIAANMDQYLTMSAIERAGAGRLLRAGQTTTKRLMVMTKEILKDGTSQRSASLLAQEINFWEEQTAFAAFVDRWAKSSVHK